MAGGKLTAKQATFVREYLVDLNAKQAAIRSGYSGNSAEVTGCRLLSNANVAEAVQVGMDKRSERTDITADYVLRTIHDTVERCRSDGDGFNPNAVLKGSELLGKHLKLFTDKVELGASEELIGAITRSIVDAPRA